MIAIRRLAPHVQVGLWLAGWAVVFNLLLLALASTPLLQWLPDRQTGVGFVLDNRQRVESAVEAYQTGKVQPDKFLAAIVGISNMREAVDLGVLSAAAGRQWRFIGVSGAGAGSPSIEEHSSIILDSDLRPDLVVLGIMPVQMLDTSITQPPPGPADSAGTQVPFRQRARDAIKGSIWPMARRRDIAVSTERGLLDVRRRTFEAFGVTLETVDTRSPWRAMLRAMGSERYPDPVLQQGVDSMRSLGAFDINSYRQSEMAAKHIGQTIRRFEDSGAKVIVVLTPEHSWLRLREPEGVTSYIRGRLRHASGEPQLSVVDYRHALPDDGFVDLVHINSSGSRRFSRLLGEELADLRVNGPPLMGRR